MKRTEPPMTATEIKESFRRVCSRKGADKTREEYVREALFGPLIKKTLELLEEREKEKNCPFNPDDYKHCECLIKVDTGDVCDIYDEKINELKKCPLKEKKRWTRKKQNKNQ